MIGIIFLSQLLEMSLVENGGVSLVQDSEDAEDVNQTVPTIWNYFKVGACDFLGRSQESHMHLL